MGSTNNISMSAYTQILYQIVFSTKDHELTMIKPSSSELIKKEGLLPHFKGWQDG
jgi:hypothetical protein